ncbi:hypothetical protein DICVIV_11764 [Dictyocaulus viviparus]|uniref:Uncharacterized protein n=1 Tax=Dictyocaulus viviparus TaxID=29172 RepID=A0A0D8XEZ9_DICVI|nr:hypothetical protein DICVIV_11764 [Dictyocaulus viviparus]
MDSVIDLKANPSLESYPVVTVTLCSSVCYPIIFYKTKTKLATNRCFKVIAMWTTNTKTTTYPSKRKAGTILINDDVIALLYYFRKFVNFTVYQLISKKDNRSKSNLFRNKQKFSLTT